MKRTILVVVLLCVALTTWAQSAQPFKKAKVIEIQTSLTPTQAYKALGQLLQGNGYGIASSDAALGSITTTFKTIRNAETQLHGAVAGDSLAVIRLTGTVDALGDKLPIEYRGMKGSIFMNAWQELETVARGIPNATVSYR